jgi:hypothetical protein
MIFELKWLGGAAERHFHQVRGGVEELPWGTLRRADYPELLADRARVGWSQAALNEYCTAAAFADLIRAMLEANAPVDLVGMASDFLADEVLHVELTSRVAMELGGGAPFDVDFARLSPPTDPSLSPLARALELGVRICCVAEAFSVPMLAASLGAAAHPLTRAVLERIVQDEAPHGRLGWLLLEWSDDRIDDAERQRLGQVALASIRELSPAWLMLASSERDGTTSEGFSLEHVAQLGFMTSSTAARTGRSAIRDEVVAPLAKFGIVVPERELEALLSER